MQELRAGPFTSKDIDFQGDRIVARRCAELLAGTCYEENDPGRVTQAAKVVFRLGSKTCAIDFLSAPHGLDAAHVRRRSVLLRVPVGDQKIAFRVMHPVDCLKSRIKNVMGLPGYNTSQGILQLRASIYCAREFIGDLARESDPKRKRAAINLSKEVHEFCIGDLHALQLYDTHAIDAFEAVMPHEGLPERFRTEHYPRMVQSLRDKRERYARKNVVGPASS